MSTSVSTLQTKPLDEQTIEILKKTANTIRTLSMDATQKANSGHPGLPLGCAEIGAYLYGVAMHYNPKNPHWMGRDRFILSAGHGCLLQYSCLHLAGYHLSLDDIKDFRQLHSKTPGHPERLDTPGIETTTGPLGQGVGNAVGQALGLKILGEKFNSEETKLIDSKVFCLAGDGCIMEGITSEASSLAGHLGLDNLILIYDSNNICLDGPLSECCSEDTKMRYRSYGWDVFEVDGYDLDAIHKVISGLRAKQERPALIVAHTIIGKGSPHKQGTHNAHGSPLGTEEVAETKKLLGLSEEPFFVPQAVYSFFEERTKLSEREEFEWNESFNLWSKENPEMRTVYDAMKDQKLPINFEEELVKLEVKTPNAGRSASFDVLNSIATKLPFLYGGSADLSGSDKTMMKEYPLIKPGLFSGRNIKYGVREFAMATIANGLEQTDMIVPFIGTFLTFSDYMRNAIRLAALQKTHVIYHFTHDSIFLGEDGPTHQPVEHYAALRAIPNLHFIRPSGVHETKMAWIAALSYKGPTAFALSRQTIPEIEETHVPYSQGMGRGGYIVKKESGGKPEYTLIATGSELPLAIDVARELEKLDHPTRVVSMPCFEIFDAQEKEYQNSVLGGDIGKRVSVEAGIEQGWHKYVGIDGICIAQDSFGTSAPYRDIVEYFGFNVDSILERIL